MVSYFLVLMKRREYENYISVYVCKSLFNSSFFPPLTPMHPHTANRTSSLLQARLLCDLLENVPVERSVCSTRLCFLNP